MGQDPFQYGVRHFFLVQFLIAAFLTSGLLLAIKRRFNWPAIWTKLIKLTFFVSASLLLVYSAFAENFDEADPQFMKPYLEHFRRVMDRQPNQGP